MSRVKRLSQRCVCALLVAACFLSARNGSAGVPPITRAEQAEIDKAINQGVVFLKLTQQRSGTWAPQEQHALGYAALPGLALLESGVPANHPAILRAAAFVRGMAPRNNKTYELALAILFLDRLGNARDKSLIQTLALRLVAGQGTSGGWTYDSPILPARWHKDILTILNRLQPPEEPARKPKPGEPIEGVAARPREGLDNGPARPREGLENGPARSREGSPLESGPSSRSPGERPTTTIPILDDPTRPGPARAPREVKPGGDGPAEPGVARENPGQRPLQPEGPQGPLVIPPPLRALAILQDRAPVPGLNSHIKERQISADNSNTQFALLGLWVAQRHGLPMKPTLELVVRRFEGGQNEDGSWGYRSEENQTTNGTPAMTCVGLIGLAVGHALARDERMGKGGPAVLDPRIARGFAALRQFLEPENVSNLYFLWSLERVAVLYRLEAIGNKDWYRYGVAYLLPGQQPDGSWTGGGYPGSTPTIDTCLALLFLKRANFVADLGKKLQVDREALTTFITDKQPSSRSSAPQTPPLGNR